MSLKFFFNRKGYVVMGLTLVGWVMSLWNLYKIFYQLGWQHNLLDYSYLAFLILAFLLTFTRYYPWYDKNDRGHGIEEHFEKNMVPVAYMLPLFGVLFWTTSWAWVFFLIGSVFFLLANGVNLILLILHFNDPDYTPPSYFARSLYLGK